MAGVTETATWENHVYRIEENDPVHGGENGVTNKPIKHLANRTLYLRKLLTEAGQRIVPLKITATTSNTNNLTGHTHEIDLASLTTKGLVQLTNDTGLDSEALALTAKGAKAITQSVAQLQQTMSNGLNQKINKSDISDAVDSNSQTTVASSKAVKTAYDLANGKLSKTGDTGTGNYTFTGNVHSDKTISSAYRLRVERDSDSFPPYVQVVNLNAETTADNREIGSYHFAQSDQNGAEITRASLQARTRTDGNIVFRPVLYDNQRNALVPWQSFSATGNTSFGSQNDNELGKLQVYGRFWTNGVMYIDNPSTWAAFEKTVKDGAWRMMFSPIGSEDIRLNLEFKKSSDNSVTRIGFPKITQNELVAYQSWAQEQFGGRFNVSGIDLDTTTKPMFFQNPTNQNVPMNPGNDKAGFIVGYDKDCTQFLTEAGNVWVRGSDANPISNASDWGDWEKIAYQSWVESNFSPDLIPLFKGEFHSPNTVQNVTVGSVSNGVITLAESIKKYRYVVFVTSNDSKTCYDQKTLHTSLIPIGNTGLSTWGIESVAGWNWSGQFIANNKIKCINESCVLHAIYGTNAL